MNQNKQTKEPTKLVIRAAKCSDIDELMNVEQSANQAFLVIPHLAWLAEIDLLPVEYHQKFIVNDYSAVALIDEQVVGFIYAMRYEEDLYILEVDVDRAKQQQGIGQQLFKYMTSLSQKDGFKRITLTTFTDVAWNAPFYRKLGFEVMPAPLPAYLVDKIDREVSFGFERASRTAMYFNL